MRPFEFVALLCAIINSECAIEMKAGEKREERKKLKETKV